MIEGFFMVVVQELWPVIILDQLALAQVQIGRLVGEGVCIL